MPGGFNCQLVVIVLVSQAQLSVIITITAITLVTVIIDTDNLLISIVFVSWGCHEDEQIMVN